MPPIVVGAGLSLKMRQLIIILLGIFIAAIVVAYGIGTLINLYREHTHTKGLAARKAMGIEAQMVAAEKRTLHRVLSKINVSNASLVPLVPSFPPVAYLGPWEKQVQAPVVSVLQVNQRAHAETPIHMRFARLSARIHRSRSDSELVTRVPHPPPIVVPTASHNRLVRSPATITMCDRYPTFAPSYPLPLSEPGVGPSSTEKPLQATVVEGAQGQKQRDRLTAVTALPIPLATAAEKPVLYLYTIHECENAGQDGSGKVTDPTPAADADANTSTDADADTSGSLLAYHRRP